MLIICSELWMLNNSPLFKWGNAICLNRITDKNILVGMKDNYTLLLFLYYCLAETMKNGNFDDSYYTLQFVLMHETKKSPIISLHNYNGMLSTSYSCFVSNWFGRWKNHYSLFDSTYLTHASKPGPDHFFNNEKYPGPFWMEMDINKTIKAISKIISFPT